MKWVGRVLSLSNFEALRVQTKLGMKRKVDGRSQIWTRADGFRSSIGKHNILGNPFGQAKYKNLPPSVHSKKLRFYVCIITTKPHLSV